MIAIDERGRFSPLTATVILRIAMKLGDMADLTADTTPDKRERIESIKAQMVDAERGHELAALRKAQSIAICPGHGAACR
ncbi:hypothetical protein ABIA33_004198 [Streptacidiphilus sp. MAP12-16]|uniref:hypothetical protein n=1 Tax=Streptacidiphilus sp. MAP12-16 TaxID=3156300 RepID=UPI0035133B2A